MQGNFTYYNPTKLYFGEESLNKLKGELANFGQTVLLNYGSGSVKRNGIYDQVAAILREGGKTIVENPGVMSNPTLDKLHKGVRIARDNKVDWILALGGGSVCDYSKGVAASVNFAGDYWQEFWLRRQWNPQCTNKDAQRPRLTYLSNCKNVTIQDVHLVNSPFWTNHIYKSHHVRYLDCYIYAPTENVFAPDLRRGAPSSDAIDVDACTDVLVNGCFMHVNDDAVVMKGGKGTWADQDETNGPCERVLIQNCRYGRVHGCLTLGSEAVHCRNIILRNCYSERTDRVLWLKMRPDTPQHYEYVLVENMTGHCDRFLFIRPWTQFFKPGDRKDMPQSRCNNIIMRNNRVDTKTMLDVKTSDKYELVDFVLDGSPLDFSLY